MLYLIFALALIAWQSSLITRNSSMIKSPKIAAAHAPISINGNSQLDAFVSGGTDGLSWETAHVIENYEIDANWFRSCLHIENTDRYLIIRYCTFFNSGFDYYDTGLAIESCSNVKMINCVIRDNNNGLVFTNVHNSSIENCRATNNAKHGFTLHTSTDIEILNCRANSNGWGIFLYMSHRVIVKTNRISDTFTSPAGILIQSSNNNTVNYNTVFTSAGNGIYLDNSISNHIYKNVLCNNNDDTILEIGGSNNNIHDNSFTCPSSMPSYPFLLILAVAFITMSIISYKIIRKHK